MISQPISRTTHPHRIRALRTAIACAHGLCNLHGDNLATLSDQDIGDFNNAMDEIAKCHRDCGNAVHLSAGAPRETLHGNRATQAAMENMQKAS